MSKIIVVSLDGTMDSLATRPTHIANIQGLLGGEHYHSRATLKTNQAQGWRIQMYFDSVVNQQELKPFLLSYYDQGLGSPHLDKDGNIIKWSVRPLQFAIKLKDTLVEIDQTAFAEGITNNVAQAYHFLAQYYQPGTKDKDGNVIDPADQIYCLGFSRGSYTARLLATMIRTIGLINVNSPAFRKKYGDDLHQAIADGFACYKHDVHPDENHKAKAFKEKYCHDGKHLIHFMGLFETVKGWIAESVPKDRKIGNVPKFVRQALAIDEHRSQFHPSIGIPSIESSAMTAWFAGVHADVGGGYNEHNLLSNVPLHWMLNEAMQCGLPIDKTMLEKLYPANYLGNQHNSMFDPVPFTKGKIRWKDISISTERQIGVYSPGETIHPSAIHRFSKEVPIQNADGQWETKPYEPSNLTKAVEVFNDPAKQHHKSLKRVLIFNYQHNYKVPETLPLSAEDIQKEHENEKAINQEREIRENRNAINYRASWERPLGTEDNQQEQENEEKVGLLRENRRYNH
ncbi:MAG: phospholipase effector Tle1 domain-containing protein [Gammaproteobacteria bacterium]